VRRAAGLLREDRPCGGSLRGRDDFSAFPSSREDVFSSLRGKPGAETGQWAGIAVEEPPFLF
jgi:hypothetical protein